MKPIDFPECNRTYKAEGCGDLRAYNDGKQTITCWEMDAEDFDRFLNGEKIYVAILAGDSTPPIQVFSGKPPFMRKNEKDIDPDKEPA